MSVCASKGLMEKKLPVGPLGKIGSLCYNVRGKETQAVYNLVQCANAGMQPSGL